MSAGTGESGREHAWAAQVVDTQSLEEQQARGGCHGCRVSLCRRTWQMVACVVRGTTARVSQSGNQSSDDKESVTRGRQAHESQEQKRAQCHGEVTKVCLGRSRHCWRPGAWCSWLVRSV